MIYINIEAVPSSVMNNDVFRGTIADIASNIYEYNENSGNVSIDHQGTDTAEVMRRIGAAIHILTDSRERYDTIVNDHPIYTIKRTVPAVEERVAAPVEAIEAPPMQRPAPGTFTTGNTGDLGHAIYAFVPPVPEPVRNRDGISVIPAPVTSRRFNVSDARIADDRIEEVIFRNINTVTNNNADALLANLREYDRLMREMVRVKRVINELSADIKDNPAVKSVIEQLRTISNGMPENKITDCYITEENIILVTAPIHANGDNGVLKDLGRVRIVIPIISIVGSGSSIYFHPVDRCIGYSGNPAYLLPHVRADESFCYGNATEMFVEALANRDLIMVVDLAIRFLENPNLSDPLGRIVEYWPEVATNV